MKLQSLCKPVFCLHVLQTSSINPKLQFVLCHTNHWLLPVLCYSASPELPTQTTEAHFRLYFWGMFATKLEPHINVLQTLVCQIIQETDLPISSCSKVKVPSMQSSCPIGGRSISSFLQQWGTQTTEDSKHAVHGQCHNRTFELRVSQ